MGRAPIGRVMSWVHQWPITTLPISQSRCHVQRQLAPISKNSKLDEMAESVR